MKIIVLLLITSTMFGQVYDTLIDKGIYKSYFNLSIKQPVAVVYRLYHGGGLASRNNNDFVGTQITLQDKDYKGSGYDRGHLVPAEDFAFSDSLQALTFSYYNCVPQHPKLNREKWRTSENNVRKLSQKDTIIVVCYNEYKKKQKTNFAIPAVCYKLVYSKEKELLIKEGYSNDEECKEIKVRTEIIEMVERLIE